MYNIIRWEKGDMCRNREGPVQGGSTRRKSPFYDNEGDPGVAWYELSEVDAMCTFGTCTGTDSEAWLAATKTFFDREFKPAYEQLKSVAGSSGMPMTDSQTRAIQESQQLIEEWERHRKAVNANPPSAFSRFYLLDTLKTTVNFFDEAACRLENDLLPEIESIRPGLVEPPAVTPVGPPPGGGKWIRPGHAGGAGSAPPPKNEKSMASTALGVVALGAAGYFAFKVLTE